MSKYVKQLVQTQMEKKLAEEHIRDFLVVCTKGRGGVDKVRKLPVLEVRGAFVDGLAYDRQGAEQLARMPTRAELQGRIVSCVRSPGAAIGGALIGPAGRIAGCLKSIIERAEKQAA
jgi:ribosomal protein L10